MKLQYLGTSTKYDVEVMAVSSNIVEVQGALPMKEKGFRLFDDKGNEYNYADFKTLYRAIQGGYQYSNDGEIWEEPTKDVDVKIEWRDDDDAEGMRPEEVTLSVADGGVVIEELVLTADMEWHKVYHGILESHELTVEGSAVTNYQYDVEETTVMYTLQKPHVPTIEEQIEEIMDFLEQLDERVYILEGGE